MAKWSDLSPKKKDIIDKDYMEVLSPYASKVHETIVNYAFYWCMALNIGAILAIANAGNPIELKDPLKIFFFGALLISISSSLEYARTLYLPDYNAKQYTLLITDKIEDREYEQAIAKPTGLILGTTVIHSTKLASIVSFFIGLALCIFC